MILNGTADVAVSFEQAEATAAAVAQSKLIAYDGGTHGIVVTERDRVTSDLLAFIAD